MDQKDYLQVSLYQLPSFTALCHDNVAAGQAYETAIHEHTSEVFASFLKEQNSSSLQNTGILSVPRGGVPTGVGLSKCFNQASMHSHMAHLAESSIKHSDDLYPSGFFDEKDTIIIADGIIGTGTTIIRHLEQIPEDWQGKTIVFANATSELGIENIEKAAKELGRSTQLVTGRVFNHDECQWFEFPDKKVYFVGFNDARGVDYKLPDFGDQIIQPAPSAL